MNKSYSKIRHIQQSNMILEQRRRVYKFISESVDLGTTKLYWTTCGGTNVLLTDESKKKLQLDGEVSGKQYLHFAQEPNDVNGNFNIMDCLGPEVDKKNDLFIDEFEGNMYLTKSY